MVEFTIEYDAAKVRRALRRLPDDVADLNRRALEKVALQTLRQSETQYMRPGGDEPGPNMQSGPGSLRRVTGKLSQSLNYEMKSDFEAVVGASVDYASAHEYGSPVEGIPKRPYLRPALEDVFSKGAAQQIFDKEFRALKKRFNR